MNDNVQHHIVDSYSEKSNESWRSGRVRQDNNTTAYQEPAVEPDPAPNWDMETVAATLRQAYATNDLHPTRQFIYVTQKPTTTELPPSFNDDNVQDIIHVPESSQAIYPLADLEPGTMKATARSLTRASGTVHPESTTVRVHVDGGANRSITNNKDYLLSFRNIKKYPMSGVAAGDAALTCTSIGYLPWQSDTGKVVLVNVILAMKLLTPSFLPLILWSIIKWTMMLGLQWLPCVEHSTLRRSPCHTSSYTGCWILFGSLALWMRWPALLKCGSSWCW